MVNGDICVNVAHQVWSCVFGIAHQIWSCVFGNWIPSKSQVSLQIDFRMRFGYSLVAEMLRRCDDSFRGALSQTGLTCLSPCLSLSGHSAVAHVSFEYIDWAICKPFIPFKRPL